MRLASLVLIGVLGGHGVASAYVVSSRAEHVLAKGGNVTAFSRPTQIAKQLWQTRATGGNKTSLAVTSGAIGGRAYYSESAQSYIGDIKRTENVTRTRGTIKVVSTVESMGARPSKTTVTQRSIFGGLLGLKTVKVERQNGGQSETVRDRRFITINSNPLF